MTSTDVPGMPTSLEKSLRILFAFTPLNEPMRLSALSRATHLTIPTTHRLASSLVQAGLLQFDPENGTYGLGLRVLDLSLALLDASPIRRAALPHMARLYRGGEQNVVLGAPDGAYMVILERLWDAHSDDVFGYVAPWHAGARLPMLYTALGRAYLAWLDADEQEQLVQAACALDERAAHQPAGYGRWTPPLPLSPTAARDLLRETRARGIAYQDRELEPETCAIACPIFGRGTRPRASIGVISHELGTSVTSLLEEVGPWLQATARRISASLGQGSGGRSLGAPDGLPGGD